MVTKTVGKQLRCFSQAVYDGHSVILNVTCGVSSQHWILTHELRSDISNITVYNTQYSRLLFYGIIFFFTFSGLQQNLFR